jgi:hypothetical protein
MVFVVKYRYNLRYMSVFVVQRIIILFFVHIIYAPFWWYTSGLALSTRSFWSLFRVGNDSLMPMLWFRNLLVPMFGQWDMQGRVVSFFIRLANVFVRSIFLFVWFLIVFSLYIFWVMLPVTLVISLISVF